MTQSFHVFVVGSKDRPTVFLMRSGECSDSVQDAMYHMDHADAEREIAKCDEPDLFRVYQATVTFDEF